MARLLKGYPEAPTGAANSFSDVPGYAENDVELVSRLGLITGYSSTEFGPSKPALRGQVALVMSRYLDLPPFPPSEFAP
jgi:hypothetical protein